MPRRAAFCKSLILVVTPIASRCLERLGVTAPSAPTTTGTTFVLTFQSRATSLRRSIIIIIIIIIIVIIVIVIVIVSVSVIVIVIVNKQSYMYMPNAIPCSVGSFHQIKFFSPFLDQ